MSAVKKVKPLVAVSVDFETFSDPDFIPPGSFYMRNAIGDYIFLKTSNRQVAQK